MLAKFGFDVRRGGGISSVDVECSRGRILSSLDHRIGSCNSWAFVSYQPLGTVIGGRTIGLVTPAACIHSICSCIFCVMVATCGSKRDCTSSLKNNQHYAFRTKYLL